MTDHFRLSDHTIRELAKKLEAFGHAIPIACQQTLNRMAFQGRAYAQEIIGEKMILRNQWTARSVQVDQAKGLDMRAQRAVLGSTEPYMATQEFGGGETAKGKHGVPIPTTYSSGEAQGAIPRRKVTRRSSKYGLSKMRIMPPGHGWGAQGVAMQIHAAVKAKRSFVFLDLGRTKGIFRVTRHGKEYTDKGISTARIKLLWDLSHKTTHISAHRWLEPAADRARKDGPLFAREALLGQAKYHKLIP